MKTFKMATFFIAIFGLAVPSMAAISGTVDIVHDGYGAHEDADIWAAGYAGTTFYSGVYMLNKTDHTGEGALWANGPIPAFCIELQELAPDATSTYFVTTPDDVYNSHLEDVLGTAKASHLSELWGRYYDDSWGPGGTYTAQQNAEASAFAVAVWEIVYEDLPTLPSGYDVSTDGSLGDAGFYAVNVDVGLANSFLHSLDGTGPLATLRSFTHAGKQDFLVEVPEPATIVLFGIGTIISLCKRKRKA